jgi:hypothetical protein
MIVTCKVSTKSNFTRNSFLRSLNLSERREDRGRVREEGMVGVNTVSAEDPNHLQADDIFG